MTRVIAHLSEALDDLRHPGQRPEVRAESRDAGTGSQGPLDVRPLRRVELGRAARPARGLQGPAAVRLPGVIPVVGGHPRDSQCPRHRCLRLAPREQSRRSEPPGFQRLGKVQLEEDES